MTGLAAECDTLCRYLTGRPAPPEVVRHYVRAHELGRVDEELAGAHGTGLDRLLVLLARGGPAAAGLADAVAVLAAKKGALRRKLVLLLAILESARATWRPIDTVEPHGFVRFAFDAALTGAGFALRALAGGFALVLLAAASPFVAPRPAARPPR